MNDLKPVDHSALIVSQITIVILNIVAFVLNQPLLVALVTVAMLLGALLAVPGFGFLYHLLLRPLRLVRPRVLPDHSEPHRFAQAFGGVVMLAGALCLLLGVPIAGWALVWLVTALAALNAFGGFCLGCFIYYWLARLGMPGFSKLPPEATFPGMRPKAPVTDEH